MTRRSPGAAPCGRPSRSSPCPSRPPSARPRDIVHRVPAGDRTVVRLLQCKRYTANVGSGVIGQDTAKVWVNVLDGTIPDRPDEVAFYVAPDLTDPAKDLIGSQARWRQEAPEAVRKHLKGPVPEDVARHAREWWPAPAAEAALSPTERARKFPELVEEFFGVRKVVDGGVGDVAEAVCDRVLPPLSGLDERVARPEQAVARPCRTSPRPSATSRPPSPGRRPNS